MKRVAALTLVAIVLLVSVTKIATPTVSALPSGLVSWWPGDGNANDIAGTNHGTLQGGTTFAPGKVGQAFSFDGVDDFVSVLHNSSFIVIDLTIEAWINFGPTVDVSKPFSIVERWELDKSLQNTTISYSFSIGDHGMGVPGQEGKLSFQTRIPGAGSAFVRSSTLSWEPNRWYHVAMTALTSIYNTDQLTLYRDGTIVGTGSTGHFRTSCNIIAPIAIGAVQRTSTGGFQHPAKGLIDEVKIYNRALLAEEIRANAGAGTTTTTTTTTTTQLESRVSILEEWRTTIDSWKATVKDTLNSLANDLTGLAKRVTDLETWRSVINEWKSAVDSAINNLRAALEALTGRVGTVEEKVENLDEEMKYITIHAQVKEKGVKAEVGKNYTIIETEYAKWLAEKGIAGYSAESFKNYLNNLLKETEINVIKVLWWERGYKGELIH